MTVAEYLKEWLEVYVDNRLKPDTERVYRLVANKYYIPTIGHVELKSLTVSHSQSVIDRMVEDGKLKPGSIKSRAKIFAAAIERAFDDRLIDRNPARIRKLVLPDPEPVSSHAMSKDEATAFMHQALAPMGTGGRWWYGPMLATAIMTGMRASELRGLRWRNVWLDEAPRDEVAGIITVCEQLQNHGKRSTWLPPKSVSGFRDIPITHELAKMLVAQRKRVEFERRKDPSEWTEKELVFPSTVGTGAHVQSVAKSRKTIARAAKIGYTPTFHDTRHTFATLQVDAGVPPQIVCELLGHESVAITIDVYYNVSHEGRRQATKALMSALPKVNYSS